ncbi:MAG TPA: hypothetical protein VE200_00175 [Xanthobacteraceae bacterium]|nr:hypothetical protein [Xanthobacteraceae bacterium]
MAAIAAAAAMLCPTARAHEWPEGPNKHYLENLQRPDNAKSPERWTDPKSLMCCGVADTVKTRFRIEPAGGRHPEDRWYAWLKEEWVLVPPEKIVPDFAPDGQPYLFLLAGTIQCFVRPKGGL